MIGSTSSGNALGECEAKMICPSVASGKQADPTELVTEIQEYLKNWTDDVIAKIYLLESILTGNITEMTEEERRRNIRDLVSRGIPYEEAVRMLTKGGDTALSRHVSIRREGQPVGSEVMEPYVFLSFDEYNNISSSFTSLILSGTITAKKEALFDMCNNLILTQISPDELPAYQEMTMNEIWLEFFQVDFNIEALRDRRVSQIRSMDENSGFQEAYDALVEASLNWDALNIEEREWIAGGNGKEQFLGECLILPWFCQ